jgi:hypothetical protein
MIEPEGDVPKTAGKSPNFFGKSAQNKAIVRKRDLQGLLICSVTPRDRTGSFSTSRSRAEITLRV